VQAKRNSRNDNRAFRGIESLEGRMMFDTVPAPAPVVISSQFDDSRAPHELRVRFSSDVWQSLDGSDITLISENGRFVFPGERLTVNWDFATNTAHFVFVRADGGMLPEGTWHATLLADGITDASGMSLDGDADGLPGGDHALRFAFNQADANHDGLVDLLDFNVLAANFGRSGRTFADGDFDYSGRVDLADFAILAQRMAGHDTDPPNAAGAIDQTEEAWSKADRRAQRPADLIQLWT
jgi:hypothetical protein